MARTLEVEVLSLPRYTRAFNEVSKINVEDCPKKTLYMRFKYRAYRNAERCMTALRAFCRKYHCEIMQKDDDGSYYVRALNSKEFERYLREHEAIIRHYAHAEEGQEVIFQSSSGEFKIRCKKEDEERARAELAELDKKYAKVIRLQRERQRKADRMAREKIRVELMEYDAAGGEDLPGALVAGWYDEIRPMLLNPPDMQTGEVKPDAECFTLPYEPPLVRMRNFLLRLLGRSSEENGKQEKEDDRAKENKESR